MKLSFKPTLGIIFSLKTFKTIKNHHQSTNLLAIAHLQYQVLPVGDVLSPGFLDSDKMTKVFVSLFTVRMKLLNLREVLTQCCPLEHRGALTQGLHDVTKPGDVKTKHELLTLNTMVACSLLTAVVPSSSIYCINVFIQT